MEQTRQVIIMADDDPTVLLTGKNLLKDTYDVFTVPSAAKLLSMMEKISPALILLDVEMPEMSGYDAIRVLKASEETRDIPVIFLTAHSDAGSELEGLSLGAIEYITKPFSAQLLQKRIENILLLVSQTQKLKLVNEQLVQANNAKSRFLAQVSHEIRTPMNAIIGMTDLMRTDNLDKTQLSYFYDIRQMGRALLEIINDILDFSKIESGKMDIIPIDFNLPELFDHICSVNRFLAVNKDLEFRSHYDDSLPEVLFADETRIRQVVTNLVGNAIKYTHVGCVTLSFFKTERDGAPFLAARVEDTGIGIKQEDFDKLFTTFKQLDQQKNRAIGGTGLGLAITKLLLGMMGGAIEFSSDYERGSVFTAFFPLVAGNPEKITHSIIIDAVLAHDVAALVVDDNSVNLTVAQGYLNTHNIFPDTAKSGIDAIAMVQQKDYDVVFMDHMMPVMDGIETTKRIRALPGERFKNLPIIALTANAVSGVKELVLDAGMNAFISKPIEASELNEVLLKWLPREKIEIRKETTPALHPVPPGKRDLTKPFTRTQQARTWQASIQRAGALVYGAATTDETLLGRLSAIDGVDTKTGLMHLGGKPASYFKTIKRFCEEYPHYRATLETTSAQGDWHNYMIQAHSIKSSCAALGFRKISEWAAELERASKERRVETCLKDTPPFCQAAQALRDALEAALKM